MTEDPPDGRERRCPHCGGAGTVEATKPGAGEAKAAGSSGLLLICEDCHAVFDTHGRELPAIFCGPGSSS